MKTTRTVKNPNVFPRVVHSSLITGIADSNTSWLLHSYTNGCLPASLIGRGRNLKRQRAADRLIHETNSH